MEFTQDEADAFAATANIVAARFCSRCRMGHVARYYGGDTPYQHDAGEHNGALLPAEPCQSVAMWEFIRAALLVQIYYNGDRKNK